ncbi:hypothetical protein HCC56_11670 [Streptococcus suis]|nr:hypothetical protein [Streptococcus suis]
MNPKTIYEKDSDQDGLTDAQELALGTNPQSVDTDGDGQADLEELRVKVDSYQDEVQADMTDILEKLYRTGEGSNFIMDLMSSNSLSDTLEQYEVLDSDDYSLLSLETLQAMIQQDLAISSQDYFGDLVHLALQKDLLDQKSHFLQHYVATVMDGIPQERDQRALVLD